MMVDLRRDVLLSETMHPTSVVAVPEGLNVVLERPLVLEIGSARAIPELATVLLVRSPVAPDREGLGAFPAYEGLYPMLPLVVRLEGSEIFERLGSRMVYVVPAPTRAAITRKP